MLQENKPYIFIDYVKKNCCFLIRAIIGSSPASLSTGIERSDSNDPNTQIIEFQLITTQPPNSGITFTEVPYDINKSKISIRIFGAGGLKGSVTVRVNKNLDHFYAEDDNSRPYCWIKSSPVTGVNVFFKVNANITNQPVTIEELPTEHKLILYYNLTNTTLGSSERSFNLEDYDPSTFEFIEVHIRKQNLTRKGSGTTSQTDADSSDDN
jgi:hypothetical protein